MQFVSETVIDEVASGFELDTPEWETLLTQFHESQPVILGWLYSENGKAFEQAEKEYLLFLLMVIWKSSLQVVEDLPLVDEEQLEVQEEKNWEIMDQVKARDFRERLNDFFDGYDQEDLLAFVEDSLIAEETEDGYISPIGREAAFIFLKTVIDCFHANK